MLSEKKQKLIIFAGFALYTSTYLAKYNYSAMMVNIIGSLGTTRAAAGLVASFFLFAYGAGQFINAFLVKRYNHRYAMTAALLASSVCNLLMTFSNIETMKYVWLVNGLALSVLWSSMLQVISRYISEKYMNLALTLMGLTTAIGTILNYLLCTLFVRLGNWKFGFYTGSGVMIASALTWFFVLRGVSGGREKTVAPVAEKTAVVAKRAPVYFALAVLFVATAGNNFIKDGLTAWMPNIVHEVYQLPETASIIITMFMPVAAVFSNVALSIIRDRFNYIKLVTVFFAVQTAGFAGVVLLWNYGSAAVTAILFCIISFCAAIVANVVTLRVPHYYRDTVSPGKTAGLAEGFSYVSSGISAYALGASADGSGWLNTIFLLVVVSAACFVICGVASFTKKRTPKKPEG